MLTDTQKAITQNMDNRFFYTNFWILIKLRA